MYLRWRKDKLKSGSSSFRADVLRAYRSPVSGSPTSELVGCLGSIRESDLTNPVMRELFWMKIESKLHNLTLPQYEERKIRKSINCRVARPRNIAALLASRFGRNTTTPRSVALNIVPTSKAEPKEPEVSAAAQLHMIQHRLSEKPLT